MESITLQMNLNLIDILLENKNTKILQMLEKYQSYKNIVVYGAKQLN